jgi:hypothetical protein
MSSIVNVLVSTLLTTAVFIVGESRAQTTPPAPAPKPCASPESNQLDFWLGTWKGTWSQNGKEGSAVNTITKTHGGCVVHENFVGAGAGGLIGSSYSVFDARSKGWKQTWVDNQGGYLSLIGGTDNGAMTFGHGFTAKDGRKIQQRMRFTNVKADSFDWYWESSPDEGKTWKVQWLINYVRQPG